jgi:serine protease
MAAVVWGYRPVVGKGAETAVSTPAPIAAPTQQIIIQYQPDVDLSSLDTAEGQRRMQLLRAVTGLELTYFRAMSGGAHVLRLPAPLAIEAVTAVAAQIASLPDIAYAEPDQVMFLSLIPNDPQYSSQWHYFETYGINLPPAWDITTGSASVRVLFWTAALPIILTWLDGG